MNLTYSPWKTNRFSAQKRKQKQMSRKNREWNSKVKNNMHENEHVAAACSYICICLRFHFGGSLFFCSCLCLCLEFVSRNNYCKGKGTRGISHTREERTMKWTVEQINLCTSWYIILPWERLIFVYIFILFLCESSRNEPNEQVFLLPESPISLIVSPSRIDQTQPCRRSATKPNALFIVNSNIQWSTINRKLIL